MLKKILNLHWAFSEEKRVLVPFFVTNAHGLFHLNHGKFNLIYKPFLEVKNAPVTTDAAKNYAAEFLSAEPFKKNFFDPASIIDKVVKHHAFKIEGITFDALYIPFNDCTGKIEMSHKSNLRLLPVNGPDFKKVEIVRNTDVEHPFFLRTVHLKEATGIILQNRPKVVSGW